MPSSLIIKTTRRTVSVIANSVKQTIGQLMSLVLSVYVVHFYSKELWGNFASYFLYSGITLLILGWGNREYLIKKFSLEPRKIDYHFYLSFNSRIILLLLSIPLTLLLFPLSESVYVTAWIAAAYIAQSLEVFWIYRRDYIYSISIELVSFLVLISMLHTESQLTILIIIKWYACYQIIRAILYAILYYRHISSIHFRADIKYLVATSSFFLIGFMGFLQSRADFLIITIMEKPENIGIYQILNTYFILIHAFGTFLIVPFIKNIYRMPMVSVAKMQRKITIVSPVIVLAFMAILYLIIRYLYRFNLDIYYYVIGFFITFPPYLYAVRIIRLYRDGRENEILKTASIAIIINCAVSLLLLYFGFGLKGALVGAALAQVLTLVQYLKVVNFEQ
jgi:hypothetical protein